MPGVLKNQEKSFVESLQSHCIHTQFHWSSAKLGNTSDEALKA
jgi:hypothetical protein